MDFTQQISIIVVLFAIGGAVLWLLKTKGLVGFPLTPRTTARRLRAIERLILTPHHSLHMVQVNGREVVVGVSPAGIHVIEVNQSEAAR